MGPTPGNADAAVHDCLDGPLRTLRRTRSLISHGSDRPSDVRARRPLEQFDFRPPTTAAVLGLMRILSEAHDGWINLLPGVPEEEVPPPSGGIFSAIFGTTPEAPVSMCTWVPEGGRRGATVGQTIGILHPRGRFAVRQLGELGVPPPPGWRVRQDHARRGLVLRPSSGAAPLDVLDWTLRAGAALAVVPLTGTWQARVYLPRTGRSSA